MAAVTSSRSHHPFNRLAIETTQQIAILIEYDVDLCSFRLVCRSAHDAVDADKLSFWRKRFLSVYEKPVVGNWSGEVGNLKFKQVYQMRREALRIGADFKTGEGKNEKRCLEVLRGLIIDSFSENNNSDPTLIYESTNLTAITRFLRSNPKLLHIFKPMKQPRSRTRNRDTPPLEPSDLMKALQIMCAPMLLNFVDFLNPEHTYGYPGSQRIVYSTPATCPIFYNINSVNLDYILHSINFWKYHMLRVAESTLFTAFSDLDLDDRPRWWDTPLAAPDGKVELGRRWKGSYAFVDLNDMDVMRSPGEEYEQVQDIFAGEDDGCAFQDMYLELSADDEDFPWPPMFEKHLRSVTMPDSRVVTRAQRRKTEEVAKEKLRPQAFHFEGEGKDVSEQFLASGWLNPLPAQCGIPGWQRLTMMKYFENDNGTFDMDGLWAYEGVVLPGGKMVLGRWWGPNQDAVEDMYSGPFILWCVDGPKYAAMDAVEEAAVQMGEPEGEAI